ncbi:hypothetical protein [Riemerella columbipharyngis]|uniref:Uncharacterized protein n=1 Tax=Riemerella columbipharyngis TaxID=1071918 RepID=A0A1G7A250_9FLAO|nr:hypothetical protein [Riemerella columbipharyngis]SDE09028.1 hypothetical protein SAMN05421544_10320 [Riemerella columbipharyngis]
MKAPEKDILILKKIYYQPGQEMTTSPEEDGLLLSRKSTYKEGARKKSYILNYDDFGHIIFEEQELKDKITERNYHDTDTFKNTYDSKLVYCLNEQDNKLTIFEYNGKQDLAKESVLRDGIANFETTYAYEYYE